MKIHDSALVASSGDFNADGTVNAADYVVWRNGLGTTFTQADYDVWRAHFGQTRGSGASHAAIPEPCTSALTLVAMALLLLLCRAHHAGLTGWKHVWKPASNS
jgi:hypothetical protein